MDALQPSLANTQAAAVNPQQPCDAAAPDAPANDDASQGPISFQALLAQLKTLKLGHANAGLPTKPAGAADDDAQTKDKSDVELDVPAAVTTAAPALPLALLPPSPATDALPPGSTADTLQSASAIATLQLAPAADTRAGLKSAATVKAAREDARTSDAGTLKPGTDAPQLKPTPAAGKEIAAADLAARGEPLPSQGDFKHPPAGGASTDAQSALQASVASLTAAAKVAPPPAMAAAQISTPVATAAWGNELGQHMVWMIGQQQHVAELHLNPPHLGPLDITLTIDDKQTTAVFTSPHGAVRDAITAELPRLREVLADSGITLGNASVTSDSPRDGSAFAPQQQTHRGLSVAAGEAAVVAAPSTIAVRRLGMVDLFA